MSRGSVKLSLDQRVQTILGAEILRIVSYKRTLHLELEEAYRDARVGADTRASHDDNLAGLEKRICHVLEALVRPRVDLERWHRGVWKKTRSAYRSGPDGVRALVDALFYRTWGAVGRQVALKR